MKKLIFVGITLIICFVSLSFNVVNATEQYVNDSDVVILNNIYTKLNEFLEIGSGETLDISTMKQKGSELNSEINALLIHNFTTELGDNYSKEAVILKSKAGDLSKEVDKLIAAYESNDDSQILEKIDSFNTSYDAYLTQLETLDGTVTEANKIVDQEDANTNNLYVFALVSTAAVSLATFIWYQNNQDNNPDIRQAQKQIALNSLWPIGGALVTFLTYTFAASGGTYTIAWGAIIFGLVAYAKAIVNYVSLRQSQKAIS